ncbi:hypothetical protein BPOR_1827g00020 [Botrytis porri]|uniref:Uncharacterized protein n=1 Tax=Botrytis porri TaxID=87229 RepID=A0A4Z1K3D9_9HELO|nr:hypothetical protein BPOR_1827g00020 [Botrytis porri]
MRLKLVSNVPITFEREFDFAEAPSNFTNQRWNSLFPLNDGFFEHLDVGPDPVTFAVFHQLHCLDGIRHAYWLIRNGNHSEGGNSSHAENSANARVQHCLEYLRQSLMCTADTTVEPVGRGSKGKAIVQGFGTQHLCKDFHQLIEWTSQWENPFEKIE